MEKRYKVFHYTDNDYVVVKRDAFSKFTMDDIVFKGSLSDCEAYIRLNENGYM